jgi:hypothetical protein
MIPLPFSRRGKPPPDKLSYELPEMVRLRVVHSFQFFEENGLCSWGMILDDAGKHALLQYGGLRVSGGVNGASRVGAGFAGDNKKP